MVGPLSTQLLVVLVGVGIVAVTGFIGGTRLGMFGAYVSAGYLSVETENTFLLSVFILVSIGVAFATSSYVLTFIFGGASNHE